MILGRENFFVFFESDSMQDRITDIASPFIYENDKNITSIRNFNVYFNLPTSLVPELEAMTGKLLEHYIDKYLIDEGSKDYPYYVTFFPHHEIKFGCNYAECYLTINIHRKPNI